MSSRHSTSKALPGVVLTLFAALLSACASESPVTGTPRDPQAVAVAENTGGPGFTAPSGASPRDAAGNLTATSPLSTTAAPAAAAVAAQILQLASADFERAVVAMRAGDRSAAERGFRQLTVAYPQLAAPYVNLGIVLRKAGQLDRAEEALRAAVERNGASAVAWTELGATQRLRGKFQDAAASYEKAIAADPGYAPAYRNLGVDADLFLADPERALTAFQRYKDLTGEDKPVSGWIAELRQRTGKPAAKPGSPAALPPAPAASPGEPAAPAAPPTQSNQTGG